MTTKSKLAATTAIVPSGFGTVNANGLAQYAASESDDYPGDLLKLSGKTGELIYGAQSTELPAGTRFAVVLAQARFGFIKWQDGKPGPQAWCLASDPEIDLRALRATLGDDDPAEWEETTLRGIPKDPFQESVRVPMVGTDDGRLFCFSSSARGAVRAIKKFVKYCVIHARTAPAEQAEHIPVIALNVTSYQLRQVGEIFEPVFDIVDWMPPAHVLHLLGKSGNASAFGLSNAEARNADLGELALKPRDGDRGEPVLEPSDDDDDTVVKPVKPAKGRRFAKG